MTAPWDLNQIFRIADDETQAKWDIECERMRPKLQAVDRQIKASLTGAAPLTTSAWREHLQIARVHSKRIQNIRQRGEAGHRYGDKGKDGTRTEHNQSRSTLDRFLSAPETMPWAQAILKIERQEPFLERMFSPIISEWRETAKRLDTLKMVSDRQDSISTSSQKLNGISEQLSVARDNIQRIGRVCRTQALCR